MSRRRKNSKKRGSKKQTLTFKERGNKAFGNKQYATAIGLYSKAIAQTPDVAAIYTNRSLCYFKTGKHAEARADAEKSVELDASWIKGYFRAAEACIAMEQFDDALALIVELKQPVETYLPLQA